MASPDVAFSAAHFADSANLNSDKIAGEEGLKGEARQKRALEILRTQQVSILQPEEGQYVRSQAIADAPCDLPKRQLLLNALPLAIRKILNTATGDVRLATS